MNKKLLISVGIIAIIVVGVTAYYLYADPNSSVDAVEESQVATTTTDAITDDSASPIPEPVAYQLSESTVEITPSQTGTKIVLENGRSSIQLATPNDVLVSKNEKDPRRDFPGFASLTVTYPNGNKALLFFNEPARGLDGYAVLKEESRIVQGVEVTIKTLQNEFSDTQDLLVLFGINENRFYGLFPFVSGEDIRITNQIVDSIHFQ